MDVHIFNSLVKGIMTYGRKVEIALLNTLFFDGDQDEVIKELSLYQNEDGGFGYGLEPDYMNPFSSPIQTWQATLILRDLEISSDHQMIVNILSYLEKSYQKDIRKWALTIPSNNEYPHAPWWHHQEQLELSFNPSASLAGFIFLHANPNSLVYLYAKEVIYDVLLYVSLKKDPIEVHEMRCILDLVNDLDKMDKDILSPSLKERLLNHMDLVIEKDSSQWFTSYSAKPSSIITSYPSFGSSIYKDLLDKEIELALLSRNEEGLWNITWSWDNYPEAFKKASRTYQAIIALNYLKLMKALK